MRRISTLLTALLLALLMIFTDAASVLAEPGSPAAAAMTEAQTLARSRKKKNSATATPAAGQKATPPPTPALTPTPTPAPTPEGPVIAPQEIADYLFTYGELPENFITKKEAQELGWQNGYRYVSDAAPGKSIGGDRFGNYEGKLPTGKGIRYIEADCNYTGGPRGAERIIWSSDGRAWYTGDHYETFTELFPSAR